MSRVRRIAGALAIVALPLTLSVVQMQSYRTLSPYDEGGHIDYLLRVLDWETLAPGDQLRQETFRHAACRGVDLEDFAPPPCGADTFDPKDFPGGSYNYLHHHSPVYYFLTGLVVRPLMLAGLDVVDAARVTDGLWVALGFLVVWLTIRRLGLAGSAGAVSIVLFAATPTVIHVSATVNNDATTLLAGAGLLLAAVLWESNPRWLPALPILAGVAVLLKGTNLVAVIGVGLYLAIRGAWAARNTARRRPVEYVLGIGLLGAGALLALGGWVALRPEGVPGFSDPNLEQLRVASVSASDVLARIMDLTLPTTSRFVPGFPPEPPLFELLALTSAVVTAATLGAGLYLASSDRSGTIGLAGFLSLPIAALVLTIANYVFLGLYFSQPPRYGIGAVPLLAVGVARGLHHRPARWAVALVAALLGVTVLSVALSR